MKLFENQFTQFLLEGKPKSGSTDSIEVTENGKVKIVPFSLIWSVFFEWGWGYLRGTMPLA
jgi:hypothetical protein